MDWSDLMKTSLLPVAFIASALAQPPPMAVLSPEVSPDRTVTFRILAPDAKVIAVSGEFTRKPIPMTKDEKGVWTVVKLYAEWGVDFIKAIKKSGRPIVLSLSPGTRDATKADFISQHAQMWRISGDFWDRWIDLKNQFPRLNTWSKHARQGGCPDADMLPQCKICVRAERGDGRCRADWFCRCPGPLDAQGPGQIRSGQFLPYQDACFGLFQADAVKVRIT